MMTGPEREDEFEAYLRRRVRIDRRLRSLDRLEPPPELDQIIIGQARQAIQVAPPVPMFRTPRWALPMGMAATILISLSVLLDLGVRDAIRKDAGRPAAMARAVVRAVAPAAAPGPALSLEPEEAPSSAPPPVGGSPTKAAPAIRTAPWPPLSRSVTVEVRASARTAADEDASTPAAGDDARSRVSEHVLATNRLRTADASASAEPMPASWQAEAQMAVVTVIGTRIHQ
jgi:hypothetical protein